MKLKIDLDMLLTVLEMFLKPKELAVARMVIAILKSILKDEQEIEVSQVQDIIKIFKQKE